MLARCNGSKENSISIADIGGAFYDNQGMMVTRGVLTGMRIVPSAAFNLLSLTRMTLDGWALSGNDKGLRLVKNGKVIKFDIPVRTSDGVIYCTYFKRDDTNEITAVGINSKGLKLDYVEAHQLLAHANADDVRATANHLG